MRELPPEHPRCSTTDDVECFFSVLRDVVGKDFTLKQVRMYFQCCVETTCTAHAGSFRCTTYMIVPFHCHHRCGMVGERSVLSL